MVTLLTGLCNLTPPGLLGAAWYGFPVTWIRRLIIAPQLNPWVTDYTGLVEDLVFWILVVSVVFLVVNRYRGRG